MKKRNQSFSARFQSPTIGRTDSMYSCSTIDKTMKTDANYCNSIADSLKFFVNNSGTIKFIPEQTNDKFQKVIFTRQSLYNSIYHQDKFKVQKEKKKSIKSSHKNYFIYDDLLTDKKNKQKHQTFYQLESLISDLKINCKDRMMKSIEDGEKLKFELEKNCEFLSSRLKQCKEEFNYHKSEITEIKNDTDKIKRLKGRINSESTYINTEIPLIKDILNKGRSDIEKNNKEITVLKNAIFNEEKQVNFFEDEIEMLKEKIKQIDKEKQKIRHDIINYKRKNDILKENLRKENLKSSTLMNEMEYIIYQNKN